MHKDSPQAAARLQAAMEPQEVTLEVLGEKYAKGDERTADDVFRRTARALARDDEQAQRFTRALGAGFVPGGRIRRPPARRSVRR